MSDPERPDDKGNESSPPEPREEASEAASDKSASQFLDALRQILAELGIREEDPRLQILVQRVQALTSYHGPNTATVLARYLPASRQRDSGNNGH